MKYLLSSFFVLSTAVVCFGMLGGADEKGASERIDLPPVETFVLEPTLHEMIDVWVPSDRIGPEINRSCRPIQNCLYSCSLPVVVNHAKTGACPDGIGRMLVQYVSPFHKESVPLTIFNGWQWEYSFSISQYDAVTYDLPSRGGSWENSWEAKLSYSTGLIEGKWIQAYEGDDVEPVANEQEQKSTVEVKTFSLLRIRHGYPKERQL